MPNDAKLGLVVGVGLVIAIAVVFFRKDTATAHTGPANATVLAGNTPGAPPTSKAPSNARPTPRTPSTNPDPLLPPAPPLADVPANSND